MKKHTLILSSAAILGISGIIAAYIQTDNTPDININENASNSEKSVEISKPTIIPEPDETPEIVYEPVYYMLTAEGDALNLYEIDGDNKKTVKTAEITPDIFPKEDIELLKNGIHAFSLEEGIEIMENFIS